MGDLIFLAIIIGFFAITVVFVKACDSIIGPDPDMTTVDEADQAGAAAPGAADSAAPETPLAEAGR